MRTELDEFNEQHNQRKSLPTNKDEFSATAAGSNPTPATPSP